MISSIPQAENFGYLGHIYLVLSLKNLVYVLSDQPVQPEFDNEKEKVCLGPSLMV